MQRMRREAFDGAHRRDQRLPDHLSAEHALPAILRREAAKQVHLELFEVEHIEHRFDGSFGHRRSRAGTGRTETCRRYAKVKARPENETGPAGAGLDRSCRLLLRADEARFGVLSAGCAVVACGRHDRCADAQRAHHDLVRTAITCRGIRHHDAQRHGRARNTGGSGWAGLTLRTCGTLRAGVTFCPRDALRTGRSAFASGPGGTCRTRCSARSRRALFALHAGDAGGSGRPLIALCPGDAGGSGWTGRSRGTHITLCAGFTFRPLRACGPLRTLRTDGSRTRRQHQGGHQRQRKSHASLPLDAALSAPLRGARLPCAPAKAYINDCACRAFSLVEGPCLTGHKLREPMW